MAQENNQPQLQVKITDEVLKGVYANFMQVGHTKEEFVFDFMNIYMSGGIVTARVILSPGHVKRMITALQENMKNYENSFGKVEEAAVPDKAIGFKAE